MAESVIKNNTLKTKFYNFTNLAQYELHGYYLVINNIKSKIGLPSTARLLVADNAGWSLLGSVAYVSLPG